MLRRVLLMRFVNVIGPYYMSMSCIVICCRRRNADGEEVGVGGLLPHIIDDIQMTRLESHSLFAMFLEPMPLGRILPRILDNLPSYACIRVILNLHHLHFSRLRTILYKNRNFLFFDIIAECANPTSKEGQG